MFNRRSVVSVAGGGTALWVMGGLVSAGVAAAAVGGMFRGDNPQLLVRSGMNKFRQNQVEESLQDFDQALQLDPRLRPFLWQRGLSLYYVQQYDEGAKQFRDDVAVNPNDTEESIWAFLCEAKLQGPEEARQNILQVGRDPRPVMRAAYEAFMHGSEPDAILRAAAGDAGGHDAFYANLYVGLWHEAHGNATEAQAAITTAVGTQYAQRSGDYMADLAKVHCKRRGWPA
eukprot:gene5845-6086_t